ncbi:phosphohistidine phosphatase SixA [Desulfosarcina widdelii]|uniref:Phosphohistidine phosphatase SixA n=1 Tax=Desulfosarcina widdelii TaxID=947919 RepID=A0A5K7ZF69_9BACT|nr:phosphohistidine phosphatase SixA [Desulfosarcina widdelii]
MFLVRHAKSSWKDPRLSDHQRPLNKRGKKAASEMARRLKRLGVKPDVIVSSDARRALDTAAAMAEGLGLSKEVVRPMPELYGAASKEILEIVLRFDDNWQQVMVVGHNPGFTELANRFYPHFIANVPTAGVVELRFDAPSWRHIRRDNLEFSRFDFPKNKESG